MRCARLPGTMLIVDHRLVMVPRVGPAAAGLPRDEERAMSPTRRCGAKQEALLQLALVLLFVVLATAAWLPLLSLLGLGS